jgi:hypothetical protein
MDASVVCASNLIATRNAAAVCARSKILLQICYCKFVASEKSEEFHILPFGANLACPGIRQIKPRIG